jgi:GT2 family glycosyltransferase
LELSVIIVNYNVKHFLEQCLISVKKALDGIEGEIIVIDNNSVDGSLDLLNQKFKDLVVIANKENTGFSVANNQGIKIAKGENILLLNPDTVVQEDTFIKCLEFLDNQPDAGALGVKMYDGNGRFLPESKRGLPTPSVAFYKIFGLAAIFPNSRIFGKYHLGYLSMNENHKVDVLSGAFMLIRKKVLNQIGLLDETFFMYGEDIDLSYRIKKSGYENYYFSKTKIIHYKGESTKKSSINYVFVFYRAMIIFAEKHFSKQNVKTFSKLINFAIYLRASVAVIQRIFKRWILPLVDFIFFSGFIFALSLLYQNITEIAFPANTIKYLIPFYALIWAICNSIFGNQNPPIRYLNLLKGNIAGLILILSLYALLPKSIQFSRAIIIGASFICLITSLFTRATFKFLKVGLFANFIDENKNIALVGLQDEILRTEKLILTGGRKIKNIFKISPNENDKKNSFHGNIKQLHDFININKISEVIFCAKDVTAQDIIYSMAEVNSKNNIEFKIIPEKSQFIIGSQSIYTNENYFTTELNHINSQENVRKKRNFDVYISLILILLSPIFVLLFKNYIRALKNIKNVVLGEKTWIGYGKSKENLKLPKIKPGVFSILDSKKIIEEDTIQKINIIYAKDYNLLLETQIFLKKLFEIYSN